MTPQQELVAGRSFERPAFLYGGACGASAPPDDANGSTGSDDLSQFLPLLHLQLQLSIRGLMVGSDLAKCI